MLSKVFTVILTLLSLICVGQDEGWNLDFEKWDTISSGTNLLDTIIKDHSAMIPINWFYNPNNISEGSGIGRTTDSEKGNFAVTLSGFYSYQVMRITTGDPSHSGWPIDYSPIELNGVYKAILLCSTCDSLRAYVDVYLTTYNTELHVRDTIGQGHIILKETDNEYKNFNMPINYVINNELMPDSITIVIAKERFGFGSPSECYECSHVFFDDFFLPVISSSKNNNENVIDGFECFPNPCSGRLIINNKSQKTKNILIYDALGLVYDKRSILGNSKIELQTDKYPYSILFVTDGITTKKVLIMN